MRNKDKYTDQEWQNMAAYLSGEETHKSEVTDSFLNYEGQEIDNYFKMIDKERGEDFINTDNAWDKLFSRLNDENLIENKRPVWVPILRIAAAIAFIITTTFTVKYIISDNDTINMLAVQTTQIEKNRLVLMPDGSTISLNRNSQLTYPEKFDGDIRKVELSGEAFFDIVSDPSKPFVISAGDGEIRVLGTSFNVITDNNNNEVEVFVKSGKVLLVNPEGSAEITIEPGFIGKLKDDIPYRFSNTNPNYLAWNTEVLVYEGVRLEQVFEDLKRVHDINIEVLDQSILERPHSTEYRNNSPETIIKSICTSHSLSFEKKDDIYYLSK